jgi:hypothetical protein
MKKLIQITGAGIVLLGAMGVSRAAAQDPIVTPIVVKTVAPVIVDTAVPIIVNAVTPKPKFTGLAKFEGTVMNANRAQITVRAKGNDLSIQSFPLSESATAKMQEIIDKGGYQYGDKIKLEYDPQSMKVVKFKGKPSKPL